MRSAMGHLHTLDDVIEADHENEEYNEADGHQKLAVKEKNEGYGKGLPKGVPNPCHGVPKGSSIGFGIMIVVLLRLVVIGVLVQFVLHSARSGKNKRILYW